MNVHHPDMLRGGMHQGMLNQPFIPQQPQQGQQPNPHAMGMLSNSQGGNPGLGIMGTQPGVANSNYALIQGPNGHRRSFLPQHPNGPGLNPGAGPGPHMGSLTPSQLQSMQGFPGGMMGQQQLGQQQIRRVQSQPLGQGATHMSGMAPAMMVGGMGPQMMRANLTPQQQQQMQMHMRQQQQQGGQGGGMSPDTMGLPMSRAGHMQSANAMPPHARTPSGQQMMPTLTQPPTLQQSHGMQQPMQPMQHHGYGTPMALQQHHQPSSLGTSPHVGSPGQQPGMGGGMAGGPIVSQASGGRHQMSPDSSMFMFANQPNMQPSLGHNVARMPMPNMNNPPFNMAHSPAPLNPAGDMSQRGNGSIEGTGPPLISTPAQVLGGMNNSADNFPANAFGIGQPSTSAPPRPPSHNGPHHPFPVSQSQPALPSQQSPRQPEHLPNQMHPGQVAMQRPHSQPQSVHRQSPIPPRTPRVSQPSLPNNTGGMLPPRVPAPGTAPSPGGPSHPPVQPQANAPSHAHPPRPASRPTTGVPPGPVAQPTPGPTSAGQTSMTTEGSHSAPASTAPAAKPQPTAVQPAPQARPQIYPVGMGQTIARLLHFSGELASDSKERLKLTHWNNIVTTYFSERATMKLTLWKDNQQVEAKPFEIGYPIFPRFFLVTAQSGVKSQSINIDGARERLISTSRSIVECASASWTFRYTNGYSITLRGPFTAEVIVMPLANPVHPHAPGTNPPAVHYTLLFERLQFDAFWHDKYLAFDAIQGERIPDSPRMLGSPPVNANGADDANRYDEPRYIIDHAIIPAEPINAFGIPQATMRCLELAESVAQMSDLIRFSISNKMGPVDALSAFANNIRQERLAAGLHIGVNGVDGMSGAGPSSHPDGMNGVSGPTVGPSTSFGTPGHMPGPSQPHSVIDSQMAQPDASKQAKSTSQPGQGSASTPAQASTPASAPTPGGPTTPSMANASLKRKNPPSQRSGEDSPTTANAEQQQPKRPNRKRNRTQGGS